MSNYFDSFNVPIIVSGDFNARNPIWEQGCKPCPKGQAIAEELLKSNLVLLNDGSPTIIRRINCQATAIDLSIASQDLAANMEWHVEDEEFGSSYLCIVMSVSMDMPVVYRERTKVNVKKAIGFLNEIRPQFLYNPEEMQDIFEESIQKASYTVANKKANFLKRWWNKEIQEAYNKKRIQLRNYNRNPTETTT
nr:uncharacterized protein LOC115261641 [Aedes albopictus]